MRTAVIAVAGLIAAAGASLSVSAGSHRASAQDDAKTRFIGSWRLVSIESATPNPALGDRPVGMIYYDTTGHMAVQIMSNKPRPTWTGSPTPEQAKEALASYAAYYGTFWVDEQSKTVTHHREGSLTPGAVDFVRKYEFIGNRLILTPVDSETHLTWERIP